MSISTQAPEHLSLLSADDSLLYSIYQDVTTNFSSWGCVKCAVVLLACSNAGQRHRTTFFDLSKD